MGQAMVFPTILRLGCTTKCWTSARLTISCSRSADGLKALLKVLPLAPGVCVKLEQEQAEPRAHHQHTAIAVLHVSRMHHGLYRQALAADQDVALLAFDLLAGSSATLARQPLPPSWPSCMREAEARDVSRARPKFQAAE